MARIRFAAALIPALLLPAVQVPPPVPQAPRDELMLDELDQQDYEVGESPDRYAQVRYVEGGVTIRKGEEDLPLTRGVPVAEGDVVESSGRGVLQLGDGSAVAFGPGTRFRVAALFAQQDADRRVLFVLERGQLRVCRGAESDAVLRVDTPSGSGTLGARGNTRPDATFQASQDPRGDKVVLLVHGGQSTWTNAEGTAQIFAGQRLTVYGDDDVLDRVSDFNAFALDGFDQWAGDLVRPRPSESASRVPPEIRYYAGDLDANGRWVYVDDCAAWCWTPTAVDTDWSPFGDGYWGAFGGGMTWVSSDPWGYVTCHHGRWGWGRGLGWYWIPGVYYSPAWVAWQGSGPWFGWAPLGFRNRPVPWRDGGACWNVVDVHHVNDRNLRPWFHRDPAVTGIFNRNPGPGARPWFQGRLVVSGQEFRDPAAFQRVVAQPAVIRERVQVYERSRPVLRPPAQAVKEPGGFTRMERPEPPKPVPPRPADRVRVEREDTPPRTETGRREPIRPEPPRQEISRPGAAKMEVPRGEATRQESPRPVRQETPRPETRPQPARQEQPKHETFHMAAPHPESHPAPKVEAKPAGQGNSKEKK